MFKTSTSEPDFNKIPIVTSLDAFSSLATDYDTSFSPISLFTTEVFASVPLPIGKTIFDVFKCCFDDDAPVLPKYNIARGYTDSKYTPWRSPVDGKLLCGQRVFECTSVIRAMMNKQCHLTQYEKYAFYSVNNKPTLIVQTSGQICNVMFGDAFRVESLITFTQNDNNGADSANVVMMHVKSHIHFFRSVFLKGKIISNANTELKDGMKKLYDLLVNVLEKTDNVQIAQSNESTIMNNQESTVIEPNTNIDNVKITSINTSSLSFQESDTNVNNNVDELIVSDKYARTSNNQENTFITQKEHITYLLFTCITAFIVV